MKPRLLVPSIGRKVPLLRLLRERFEVFVADQNGFAPGMLEVDQDHRLWNEVSGDWLFNICRKLDIDAILPVRNEDCLAISLARKELARQGVVAVVSPPDTVQTCIDKKKLAGALPGLVPKTSLLPSVRFPAFAKLRRGAGSQFCTEINNYGDYAKLAGQPGEFIFQPLLSGNEWTVDMFFGPKGKLVQAVARWRMRVRDGQMDRGRVEQIDNLRAGVDKLARELRFSGPVNAQFASQDGTYWLIDVNPRFSGGYPLTHAAGADFVELLYQTLEGKKLTPREAKVGTSASGYTDYVYRMDGK